jgi:hypothetical protein
MADPTAPVPVGTAQDAQGLPRTILRDGAEVIVPEGRYDADGLSALIGILADARWQVRVPGAPATAPDATDPFGGHEFAYESSTDLFRCCRCRQYEVTVRNGDEVIRCPGDVPGEPMELNAY